jgi:hypothetical protein
MQVVAEASVQEYVMVASSLTLEMVFSAVSALLVLPKQQVMSYLVVLAMWANMRMSRALLHAVLAMPTLQGVQTMFQAFVMRAIIRLAVMVFSAQSAH